MSFSLSGNLLVSTTALDETPLSRSVCLVLHHDESKIIGVVLNRPLEISDKQVAGDPILKEGVHFGGPNASPVLALHDCETLADAKTEAGVFMATQRKKVEQIVQNANLSCRLIVGNVQWSVEEMWNQLNAGLWCTMPASHDSIFADDDQMWERLIRQANNLRLAHLVGARHIPAHPALN